MSKPRPLKWLWMRYKSQGSHHWRRWHLYPIRDCWYRGLQEGWAHCNERPEPPCSWEITADTPDRKDCCKKCWGKVKDETQS